MKIIVKRVQLNDQQIDIVVEDGIITSMGHTEDVGDMLIEEDGLAVSPGWFDFMAHFQDPGFEHKENIRSGLNAAASGGYTHVAVLPNTDPVIQSKSGISYLKSMAFNHPTALDVFGAVTLNNAGDDMTEMLDMYEAGALAFTDGLQPIWNTDILLKTLLYLRQRNAVVIDRPRDIHLTHFGLVNEGAASVLNGLTGIPNLAEYTIVQRDIELLRYTDGRLHLTGISTKESVDLIRKAKSEGLSISCDVAVPNLVFTEDVVSTFDSNFKVDPPLRTKIDQQALIEGLKDGTIDGITSHHLPQDQDAKEMEFDLAAPGMINLQTAFSLLAGISDQLPLNISVEKLAVGNRKCFNIEVPLLAPGQKAEFTLFNPLKEWKYTHDNNRSLSHNSPLIGTTLKGEVKGIINGEHVVLNDYT